MEQHKEGEGPYCAVRCSIPSSQPGSNRVEVMLKNITARSITIKLGERKWQELSQPMLCLICLLQNREEGVVPIVNKSAKAGLEAGTRGSGLNPQPRGSKKEPNKNKAEVDQTPLSAEQIETLLTKIDFGKGTKEWTQEQKERARALLTK